MEQSKLEQAIFYELAYFTNYPEAAQAVQARLFKCGKEHWDAEGKTAGFNAFWVRPVELDERQYFLHYPEAKTFVENGSDPEVDCAAAYFRRYGNRKQHTFFRKAMPLYELSPEATREFALNGRPYKTAFPPFAFQREIKPAVTEQLDVATILPRLDLPDPIACDITMPYDESNLKWLPESINSMLNQNNANCILHLVNDGFDLSVDQHIRDQYGHLPNVRFYRNDRVYGPYLTVNRLVDFLETDFFAVQDSDDISTPNRIWRAVTTLQETGADVFAASMEQFIDHESEDAVEYIGTSGQTYSLDQHLARTPFHVSGAYWKTTPLGCIINGTMVIRKSVFEKLNGFADMVCTADCEFATRLVSAGYQMHVSDQIAGLRRLHACSLSHRREFNVLSDERQKVYDMLEKRYKQVYLSDEPFDPWQYGSLDSYRTAKGMERIQCELKSET